MNRKKKILFISGFYYPSQLGGPCNSNHWLVNALKKEDFYVTVLATSAGIPFGTIEFDKWIHDDNGKVIYLNTRWSNFSISFIYNFLKEIRKVDLVQTSSIFSFSSFLIGILTILFRKPLIWSPRGELAVPALKTKYIVKRVFIKIINHFIDKIQFHVTSKEELNDSQFAFGENVKYILHPNYIEIPKNTFSIKKKQFVYIGRLHPIKALDKLIEALYISKYFIKESYKFLIVGSGDEAYKKYLNQLVGSYELNNNVCFLDHINDISLKNKIFSESLFSFLISESENFGNVILESISNGTPVVSSKGTPWKVLEERKAGYWISNNPISIANCIDNIIKMDEVEMNKYNICALTLAKDFDIKENIYKWVLSYNSIIQ